MALKKKTKINLARFGYEGVEVDVDATWRLSSMVFPDHNNWDIHFVLAAVVNGKQTDEKVKVRLDSSSTPPIWDVMKMPLPEPITINTVGELLGAVNRVVYATIASVIPEFSAAELVDPGNVPSAPLPPDPPVEDPPVEDPPVEDPPVEDPPVEDPPVEDPPVTPEPTPEN